MAALRTKEVRFPLSVDWVGGREVRVEVAGKEPVRVLPPPEFGGPDASAWSPEDFFVAAAASCLAVTFTGLAQRAGLSWHALSVAGTGVAGRRGDGAFGFTRVDLRLAVRVGRGDEAQADALAREAERKCLVSRSLDLPVEVEVVVSAALAA